MYQNYENETNLLCSGSIISQKHVLTAAHCQEQLNKTVKGDLTRITLIMGASDPTDVKNFRKERVAQHKVKNFISHEEYDESAYR